MTVNLKGSFKITIITMKYDDKTCCSLELVVLYYDGSHSVVNKVLVYASCLPPN